MEWSEAGVTDKWALRKEQREVHHFKKIWSFKLKGRGEVGGRESGLVYSSHKGLVNSVSPEERNQFASWHLVTCVCPCVCMTMWSRLTFLRQHFHRLQIYMCSHVHVCTQTHMGPVQTEYVHRLQWHQHTTTNTLEIWMQMSGCMKLAAGRPFRSHHPVSLDDTWRHHGPFWSSSDTWDRRRDAADIQRK